MALDDYDGAVDFDKIKQKLGDGHYRSSRKTYNIVKTSNSKQSPLGETIYIGNARADNGSRGNVYARFYDKRAQYLAKNQLFPTDVRKSIGRKLARKSGKRYEISYSKNTLGQLSSDFWRGKWWT